MRWPAIEKRGLRFLSAQEVVLNEPARDIHAGMAATVANRVYQETNQE
jgi:hypothetical protein